MKPQTMLGRETTPDGTELVLYERDGVYCIRVGGLELMSSRAHGSEDELARTVLSRLKLRQPRVLIGGLGMGFTLRAALELLPRDAEVVVSEIFAVVVRWNRHELAHLAGAPLEDPRVSLIISDVAEVVAGSPGSYDALLLDTDNGPEAFTLRRNQWLYSEEGLNAIHSCLRPKGVLGVWSAEPDRSFDRALRRIGFRVHSASVSARRGGKGPRHTIFLAQRSEGAQEARATRPRKKKKKRSRSRGQK
jgi:spermidine synthase